MTPGGVGYREGVLLRRLLILGALLLVASAVAASLSPRVDPGASDPPVPRSEQVPEVVVNASVRDGRRKTVRVPLGAQLELRVYAKSIDTVELVRLDREQPVDPQSPALFELLMDREGSYPVRLVESGRVLGRLVVRAPAAG